MEMLKRQTTSLLLFFTITKDKEIIFSLNNMASQKKRWHLTKNEEKRKLLRGKKNPNNT